MKQVLQKKSKKATYIGLLIFIVLLIALFPTLINEYSKMKIQNTKQVSTESMTMTKDEIYKLERQQRELADQYEENHNWLYDEIKDVAPLIEFGYDFMYDHPEYDKVKIAYPKTTYEIDGKDVTFISDEGKIIQAHSQEGWKNVQVK
jgi:competence protein ComGC